MKKIPVYLSESELRLITLAMSQYIDKYSFYIPEMDKLLAHVKEQVDTFKDDDAPDYESDEVDYDWSEEENEG